MTTCLWCDVDIMKDVTWSTFISPVVDEKLCDACVKKFTIITGCRCMICSRSSMKEMCADCLWWKEKVAFDVLAFNYSIYSYNEEMKAYISRWKYRGDYILAEAFASLFKETFQRVFSFLDEETIIVPIPLSEDRLNHRGFNQAEVLAHFLPMESTFALKRIHNEKQAKKTRKERTNSKNPFILNQSINKNVILVDDIYTTGATLRHAAKLLKRSGSKKVYSYTLIRG